MFLLFTDSKQYKARELDLITLRNLKLSSIRQHNKKNKGTALYGPRPFSVSLFRFQTIFGLGDALSLVACSYAILKAIALAGHLTKYI